MQTGSRNGFSKDDELRIAPGSPGLPTSVDNADSGSRASRGFARWFDRQGRQSVRESTDDMGLVYVEHSFSVDRSAKTVEN